MKKEDFQKLSKNDQMNAYLEGTLYWAWLNKPKVNKKYNTSMFCVNVVLDASGQKMAESLGLKVFPADKYTPGPFVQIKRKVKPPKTADEVKPDVVDSMQKPVPATIIVGNKSKGIVKFGRYWIDGHGVQTNLWKVQIKELAEYIPPLDKGLVADGSGYQAPASDQPPEDEEFDT